MEAGDPVYAGGWRMSDVGHRLARVPGKIGPKALEFYGDAEPGAAKVSLTLSGRVPAEAQKLGFWVYREPGDNLRQCGMEVTDAEGELFMCPVEAEGDGWHWVELNLRQDNFRPSFPDKNRNGVLDLPLRSAGAFWYAMSAGPSRFIVDGLSAICPAGEKGAPPFSIQMMKGGAGEPDEPISAVFVLTNRTAKPVSMELEYVVQQDSQLTTIRVPDPVWGSDVAEGMLSKTWQGSKELEMGSLTDPGNKTHATATWNGEEVFQVIDLGKPLPVRRVVILNSDANKVGSVKLSTSADGHAYLPFKNGESIDLKKKWGPVEVLDVSENPVRFLKFSYATDEKEGSLLELPRKIEVYDGIAGETWALPSVGKEFERHKQVVTVPPHSFECVTVKTEKPYPTGAYLLAARYQGPDGGWMDCDNVLVLPKGKLKPGFTSRFGINVNSDLYNEQIQRLGMGWVRFENMKWPMMSKQPGVFAFDGSVGPVNADKLLKSFRDDGLEVLPFLFETAQYATPDPEAKNFRRLPPTDNALYAEYCTQVAARFGQTKGGSKLLTPDKAGAQGLLKVVEIWNEPNLQDPGWGHWIGTTSQYLELLRAGAVAVKKADPKMLVSPGGWAGLNLDYVGELANYTYADGKHPSDFIDLVNVHHYTGAAAPEVARINTNVDRGSNAVAGLLYEEELDELVDWRDRAMPGKEIWMTETGYDTGGPRAVSRRDQASYSIRNLIMVFASGVDKAFIYRITGDSPGLYAASGLLLSADTYKPSFFTVANLIRLVDGFTKAIRLPAANPEARLYLFEKNGEMILAAWGLRDGVPLGLDLGSAEVVDSFGAKETRAVGADQQLGEFPLFFTRSTNVKSLQELEQKAMAARAQRKAKQKMESERRTYLFDFGSLERVGGETIGAFRKYTPVVAEDVYDTKKGYGFAENTKATNGDAHWIKDLIKRDYCRVAPQGAFIFDCEPGIYKASLQVNPQAGAKPAVVEIEGKGVAEKLEFTQKEQTRELEMKLGGQVSLRFQNTCDIFWLKLVQTTPGR